MDSIQKIILKKRLCKRIKQLEKTKMGYIRKLESIQKECKHEIKIAVIYKNKGEGFAKGREFLNVTCLFCETSVTYPTKLIIKDEDEITDNTYTIRIKLKEADEDDLNDVLTDMQALYIWTRHENPECTEREIAEKMIEDIIKMQKYLLSYEHF